jgi:glycosyltransferase involved in cell wall biosynthesis
MTARNICFPFIGDSAGGSQIATAVLINALDRTRYVPRVILHEPGPFADYLRKRDIEFEYQPIPTYVGPGRGPIANLGCLANTTPVLSRLLKQHEIAIVHPQDGRMNQTWGLPARLSGRKFIWHQHSMYAPSRLTRLAMTLANRVICVSNFVRQSLPASIRSETLTIDNPHDTEAEPLNRDHARREVCQKLGFSPDDRIVIFLGTLTAQKRPEAFLRTAAGIHNAYGPSIRFLLFGRDRDRLQPELSRLATELGIHGAVHFMGFHDPVAPWMAAADLLLAPSVNEAFSRSLVEAMLSGTPVIASASGGNGEIIEDAKTGILTPPDDASAMAAAALTLLRNPGHHDEIARSAREAALVRYSVHAYANAVMDIYDHLQSE